MAEVLSKSSILSRAISQQNNGYKRRNLPIRCSISVKNRGKLSGFSSLRSNFSELRICIDQNSRILSPKKRNLQSIEAKLGLSIGKANKWWEKGLQSNMKEITSAEDLVDLLLNAGDKLVVVDFFSPGCGGCKALHPKICQLAEMNPDVQFLQVNYEEHKSMCYSLNVHVLPFFRFYRGAEGRVCSFSCTNATYAHRTCIQKWCNKKGDINCEICNQVFTPNYSLPLKSDPDVMAVDISQAWDHHFGFRDHHLLALAAAERQLLESEYDDYAVANAGNASYLRSIAIILMFVLLIHQVLMITRDFGLMQGYMTFFRFEVSLLQLAGLLLPCYVLARSWYVLYTRRRRQG